MSVTVSQRTDSCTRNEHEEFLQSDDEFAQKVMIKQGFYFAVRCDDWQGNDRAIPLAGNE